MEAAVIGHSPLRTVAALVVALAAIGANVLFVVFFVMIGSTVVGPVRLVAFAAAVVCVLVPTIMFVKRRKDPTVASPVARHALAILGGGTLRPVVMLLLGVLPSFSLLSGVWLLAANDADPVSQLMSAGAIAGVLGLVLAVFEPPNPASAVGTVVSVCLLAGLALAGPVAYTMVVGFLTARPRAGLLNESTLVIFWAFMGPVACALWFLVSHALARVRRR
jgi:hypothetical protein